MRISKILATTPMKVFCQHPMLLLLERPRLPVLRIPEKPSNLREIWRTVPTIFESLEIQDTLVPWIDVFVARIVVIHKLLQLVPIATLTRLAFAWSKALHAVQRHIPWRVVCGAHRLEPQSI
jgi:hypothetical protein